MGNQNINECPSTHSTYVKATVDKKATEGQKTWETKKQ